jgi:hypothetical protein
MVNGSKKRNRSFGSEVLTTPTIKTTFFWILTPWNSAKTMNIPPKRRKTSTTLTILLLKNNKQTNSVVLVRKRTIPTE